MLRKLRVSQKMVFLLKKTCKRLINVFENFTLIKIWFCPHQNHQGKKSSKKELREEMFYEQNYLEFILQFLLVITCFGERYQINFRKLRGKFTPKIFPTKHVILISYTKWKTALLKLIYFNNGQLQISVRAVTKELRWNFDYNQPCD